MGTIFDAMFLSLCEWDEGYAHRWVAFMKATRNKWESDLARACRFWSLELSAVDTETTRLIREHLVPTNNQAVVMDIFRKDIVPLLEHHEREFHALSHEWGFDYQ
jgi:hypothetical protein